MKYFIIIFLFQSSICMALQPISEYCEDSYLSSSFGGDIFAAEKCLVYGYKTQTVAYFTDRNTSIAFDSIRPTIEKFIKIINTDGGTFFDKKIF